MTGRQDTIYALSSGQGRAGVAVVRVSGRSAAQALAALDGSRRALDPRVATLRRLNEPRDGSVIDTALVLWFPAPASFTGEDVVELHVHGGRAVIEALLSALGAIPSLRLAEPGEFTRRAFLNGKLDLTEAEGLADLIDAETEAQRRQALRQTGGGLRRLYEGWRVQLIEAQALVEAAIDFSDEADIGEQAFVLARDRGRRLLDEIERHLADNRRGEILREGFHVVLAGPPNVGKSSLLNALARRDAAIVSAEAGTTRDVIEVRMDLEGLPVVLMDTAGIRAATGRIEAEGIRRTLARVEDADLVVWLVDATAPVLHLPPELEQVRKRTLWVLNKIDAAASKVAGLPDETMLVSALTTAGLDDLSARLAAIARDRIGLNEAPVITRLRHREQLERTAQVLRAFLAGDPAEAELRAEDVRQAAAALGRITGRVDVEDVLDRIFAAFCIGK
jgi:tRNA modification GTPase